MHMQLQSSSLHLSQKKDLYAVSSECVSWSGERFLKDISLNHYGYINAARLDSYSVT